ncbi:MAG: beta-N-acetylhexosaminidase [Bacteroidales bacterium]|nr:beta-N-acetylhexosaminidase [Bacteroidales bacterium]
MKRLFKAIIFFVAITFASCGDKTPDYFIPIEIIPKPLSVKQGEGNYMFREDSKIFINTKDYEVKKVANYFERKVSPHINFEFNTVLNSTRPHDEDGLHLILNKEIDKELGNEGYKMEIDGSVVISANTPKGLFYGIVSLLQLFPVEVLNPVGDEQVDLIVPKLSITDSPRFSYRGMHLDVCRHFFPVSTIKKYLDIMAMHKLNTFHWHLTEDQGWRIEIKKYPLLTSISSERKETIVEKNFNPYIGDSTVHRGFYTQDEIRSIVEYAAERQITIIPEIEMPGHSLAALAAYPQLSCTGGPFETATTWGVFDDIYCAGNDSVFTFLENILLEVIDLFPSQYIHIGGDEAPKTRWKTCSLCQQRIKNEGLKDEYELQSYFIQRIEKFLNEHGKNIIGWDEILEGGLAPNATVMSWRGTEGGIAAAKQGHNVIMTPGSHMYFDHYQGEPETEPLAIGGNTSLAKVYEFEPIPTELNEKEAVHIIGLQANLWTEYIPTEQHLEYMYLPRMSALAEVAWTKVENRNWEDFSIRMKAQYKRYEVMGYNFRKPEIASEADSLKQ